MPIVTKNLRLNEQIRAPQVRVINQDNEQVGIVGIQEALALARAAGVDLVEVAPNSDPPVCRIMDYGKWKYERKKKEHKARVKQHSVNLKEVRLRPKTDPHDRQVKLNRAYAFLQKGDKVQFTMLFRGRELVHMDRAVEILQQIAAQLSEVGRVETPPRKLGRRMNRALSLCDKARYDPQAEVRGEDFEEVYELAGRFIERLRERLEEGGERCRV